MNNMRHFVSGSKNGFPGVILLSLMCLFFLAVVPLATAQTSDPNSVKEQANNNIQVASKLMDQAASLLTGTPTRYAMKTAVDLYAQAGQMAEQSSRLYEALMPQYATNADVENSKMMVQRCVDNIQQIRKRM